jgi:protein ECT2
MYNDAQLPDDEAWTTLTTDLQQTKQARNDLSKENA